MQSVDTVLKGILATVLFLIPSIAAIKLWSSNSILINEGTLFVGLLTTGIFLNIAEVIFLIRAVIFPKNKKKWWLDE